MLPGKIRYACESTLNMVESSSYCGSDVQLFIANSDTPLCWIGTETHHRPTTQIPAWHSFFDASPLLNTYALQNQGVVACTPVRQERMFACF